MRIVALLVVTFAAACTDPYYCAVGNQREPGALGCAAPSGTIDIDGDSSDWANVVAIPQPACAVGPCADGEIRALQAARHGTDLLYVRIATQGMPSAAAGDSYEIDLYASPIPPDDRAISLIVSVYRAGFDVIVGTGLAGSSYFEGDSGVFTAYGSDGIEVAIPTKLIPFEAGANVAPYRVPSDWGSSPALYCWDPTSRLCELGNHVTRVQSP